MEIVLYSKTGREETKDGVLLGVNVDGLQYTT